jgi:hypothetical protein
MSLNWYSVSISLKSGGGIFFKGVFSVYSDTNTIYHFFNSTNLYNNLLAHDANNYSADYKFINNNFTFGGTYITKIPYLDSKYNSNGWNMWFNTGSTSPNLSYKDKTKDYWVDIIPYESLFSFVIEPTNILPPVINAVYARYNVSISDGSNLLFSGYFLLDITTNIISIFHNNADLINPLSNIIAFTNDDNYADNKYVNGNFTVNGTSITSISPALDLQYNASEWQFFLNNNGTAIAYKDAVSNVWKYIMPLNSKFIVNVTLFSSDIPCFNHDTKILCLNKNLKEEYVPIQSMRKGDLVKTYLHGYKKIKSIGVNRFQNDPSNYRKCMYIMKKGKHVNLNEDLIITGDHSILVEYIFKNEKILMRKRFMEEKKIDSLKLVMSSVSNFFEKITNKDEYTYYHFCVEDDDADRNFGVWSNGILSEIPCANQFGILNLNEINS